MEIQSFQYELNLNPVKKQQLPGCFWGWCRISLNHLWDKDLFWGYNLRLLRTIEFRSSVVTKQKWNRHWIHFLSPLCDPTWAEDFSIQLSLNTWHLLNVFGALILSWVWTSCCVLCHRFVMMVWPWMFSNFTSSSSSSSGTRWQQRKAVQRRRNW